MKGLVKIKLGDQDRSLRFGINSTSRYCDIRELSLQGYLDDIENMFSLIEDGNGGLKSDVSKIKGNETRDLIYSALWAYDMENDIAVNYNRFKVGTWIDDADQNEINKIFQTLVDSNSGKIEAEKTKEPKKK